MHLHRIYRVAALSLCFWTCTSTSVQAQTKVKTASQATPTPLYKQAQAPIPQRVEDLLGRMTLEEKIGEMTQLCASSITLDGTKKLDLNVDKIRDYILKYHIGSFLSGTGTAQRWADFITAIQRVAVQESRLGIPIIFGMDNVHGSNYVDEATILPHNLNLACSFNPKIGEPVARITALESADLGHHWNFAPVLDVGRNPHWPRLYETFGEDPWWCSQMGAGFIRAFQTTESIAPYKLSACAKHFIGYSDPRSGWDRTPSEIPDQVLHEVYIPPFRAAFQAGVKTLMVNSGELNGEAVHGSRRLLTGLLRQRLGFEGVILTDIKDIVKMVEMHGAAANEKEATLMSLNAGIDMSMACSDVNFCRIVKELVQEGQLSTARLDSSVRRILTLKMELGLFENPYPRTDRLKRIASAENQQAALELTRESLVLLKNEGDLLPLGTAAGKKILVGGFAAQSKRNITGPWTLEWLGAPEARQLKRMPTLAQALKTQFPQAQLLVADSLAEQAGSPQRTAFLSQCQQADVVVLTAGETPYSEFKGNVEDQGLAPAHKDLILAAAQAGKPVVLVLFSGRPRVLADVEPFCRAIIWAGWPGEKGPQASAEVLAGVVSPSGKLAFTWPRSQSHVVNYYHKKSEKYLPHYPFGHGLSYTRFSYEVQAQSDSVVSASADYTLSVTVKNTGSVAGSEAVLVYLQDEVAPVTRPARWLKGVQKVALKPGEAQTLRFTMTPADRSYPTAEGVWGQDPGYFTVHVGDKKLRFRVR